MKIYDRLLGPEEEPYVIAEISGNHGGSLDQALKLIDAAKWAGADAVKMQLFTPDSMTLDSNAPDFVIEKGIWKGRRIWEIYAETATPPEWFPKLLDHSKDLGLHFFSSVFDTWGLRFVTDLGLPLVKVASNELTHWPLLQEVAESGLAALVSTGGSSLADILSSMDFLGQRARNWVLPFYCVSAYPAESQVLNLAGLPYLADKLSTPVGFSDHTIGHQAASLAVALGAVAVEKHIKLEDDSSSPDAFFSASPKVFRDTVNAVREAKVMVGVPKFGLTPAEENAPILKRRYFAARNLEAGATVGADDLLAIRARSGVPTSQFLQVIGSKVVQNVPSHTPLMESHLAFGLPE